MSLPSRYDNKQIWEDRIRLATLARKREDGIALTPDEDAEEAHRNARLGCYADGPEQTARRYRQDLEAADLRFRRSRFFKEGMTAPPSRKQRNDFRLLRWLYPPHYVKPTHDPEAQAQAPSAQTEAQAQAEAWDEAIRLRGHPFYDEEPGVDGNFHPFEFIEFAPGPRYCIAITGQPPIFSDEEPPGWSNYKPTAPPPGT
jgi:hypothetical protein